MNVQHDWERGKTELLNKRYNTTRNIVNKCLEETRSRIVDSSGLVPTKRRTQDGNRIYWIGVQETGKFNKEHTLSFVEINPVYLESDQPVIVRVVCLWNPMLEYWRRFAETLDRLIMELITSIPNQGKVLFKGTPNSFARFFQDEVMVSQNPSFHGLRVSLGKNNGNYYIDWSDKDDDDPFQKVTVFVEPSGNESLLIIIALDKTWSRLKWWWELLYKRMERETLVDILIPWKGDELELTETEDKSLNSFESKGNEDILNKLMPKDEKKRKLYKEAWRVWCKMNEEYMEEVLDGQSKEAKPTMQDFRSRVLYEMNWEIGERILSTVIRLGKAGLLK